MGSVGNWYYLLLIHLLLGYEKFQENVVGKELLCYPLTDGVESQNMGSKSKLLESDLQYVRLWRSWDTHAITMTYYQNKLRPPRYVQYNSKKQSRSLVRAMKVELTIQSNPFVSTRNCLQAITSN